MKHNLVAQAVARSVAGVQVISPAINQPNWLQRLSGFIVHPKIPAMVRNDVARLLAERQLLAEHYAAIKNWDNCVGQPPSEGEDFEVALKRERDAEARLELADKACTGYGKFE